MKKKLIQKIACITAAVVFSNMLPVGSVTLAAAGEKVQVTSQSGAAGAEGTDPSKAAGAEGTDPSKAAGAEGTDPSKAAEGTDQPENPSESDQKGNPGGTGQAGSPDQTGKTENAGEPDKTENAGEPDKTENPDESDQKGNSGEPDKTENPGEPDKTENPGGTDQIEKPDEQAGGTDESDQSENPGKADPSKEPEKPEKPKLKKPVLKASSKPDGTIKLRWNKVKGAAEYVLLCSTKKDSGFHSIYETEKGAAGYMDSGRVPGKVYYYRLAVFSKGRESRADSRVVSGRSLEQVKLTGISNVSGSRNLVIQWKPVKGADSYRIKRKNAATGKYEDAGSVKGKKVSFTDKNRTGGTIYTYCVCAADAAGGRGKYSDAMSQMAIDKNKKMIALTYDDGPSAYTPVVLDALAKNGGHATFFVVGNQVDRYASSVRRAVSMGCEIGNHTYDHSNLKNLSGIQVQSVLNRTSQAVKNQSGYDIHLVRPPYGSYNSAVSAAAGMPIIMWSIDTLDWKTRSTSATIQCVQQKAYDGAVVLMHDLHQPTALAADAVMRYLKNAGYQLVTVSELAAYRGGLKSGAAYSQFRI